MAGNRGTLIVSGADRPGLLDEISHFIQERGGQLAAMRIISLDSNFAFLARVHADSSGLMRVNSELPQLIAQSKVHAQFIIEDDAANGAAAGRAKYRLTARGEDQSGVVTKIAHLLRVLNINITDIDNRLGNREGDKQPIELEMTVTVPPETPVPMLRDYLAVLCAEMKVHWELTAI